MGFPRVCESVSPASRGGRSQVPILWVSLKNPASRDSLTLFFPYNNSPSKGLFSVSCQHLEMEKEEVKKSHPLPPHPGFPAVLYSYRQDMVMVLK